MNIQSGHCLGYYEYVVLKAHVEAPPGQNAVTNTQGLHIPYLVFVKLVSLSKRRLKIKLSSQSGIQYR